MRGSPRSLLRARFWLLVSRTQAGLRTLILLSVALLASDSLAAPVESTFLESTFSGTASGSLGGSPFTDATFVIKLLIDTAEVEEFTTPSSSTIRTADSELASVSISGLPEAEFVLGALGLFLNAQGGLPFTGTIGIIGALEGDRAFLVLECDLAVPPADCAPWDLASDFGPIFFPNTAGARPTSQQTDMGVLVLDEVSNVTFEARVGTRACGDGVLDPGEECDDGNNANGDGCSNRCATELGSPCNYTFAIVEFPGAVSTSAWGINHAGTIVGEYEDSDGDVHGFVFDATAAIPFVTLDHPAAVGVTTAEDINESNVVIGEYCDAADDCHSYWYDGSLLPGGDPDSFQDIRYPGATETAAQGLNDAGLVVGDYEAPPDFDSHVFSYDIVTDTFSAAGFFDCAGASFNGGDGLNASTIVGDIAFSSVVEHEYRSDLSSPGVCSTWNFPGATSTGGEGINDSGVSVGCYDDGRGIGHGYIHHTSASCRLDPPDAVDTCAEDVNNDGLVVGTYEDASGTTRSFVARPTHVPMLSPAGLIGLGALLSLVGRVALSGRRRGA